MLATQHAQAPTANGRTYYLRALSFTSPACFDQSRYLPKHNSIRSVAYAVSTLVLARTVRRGKFVNARTLLCRYCITGEGDSPRYNVQTIEGKGSGAIAASPLRAGDLVAEEAPLLYWDEDEADLHKQFEALSPEQQEATMNLADSFAESASQKTLLGVMSTNSFQRGGHRYDDDYDSNNAVLYITLSRFNHSCRPNCEGSWDERSGQLQVYACEDIDVGEELCLYYFDIRGPRPVRQERMKPFNFSCACPACANADAASDDRRSRLQALAESLDEVAGVDPEKALSIVGEMMELYDKEGLCVASYRKTACYCAYRMSLALDKLPEAKEWAQKAYEYSLIGHGPFHDTTRILKRHANTQRV